METRKFSYYLEPPGQYTVTDNPAEDVTDLKDSARWWREEYADYMEITIEMVYYSDSERYLLVVKDKYVFPGEDAIFFKKEIEAELTYQSYCRAAGYVRAKYEAYIVEVPGVHEIYDRKNPDRYPY